MLLRRKKVWVIVLIAAWLMLFFMPSWSVKLATSSSRHDITTAEGLRAVPERQTALVLGAGVNPDGTPTPYLQARVETAVRLYKAGKVHRLLMSGDNSNSHYNEPVVMGELAQSLGVREGDIALDYAGFNTYDSCYRAKHVFKQYELTVVTQGYHLPRAVATCSGLGLHMTGVAALHSGRDFTFTYILREHLSTNKALFQLLTKPQPTVYENVDV